MAAQIGDSEQPAVRTRNARYRVGQHQNLPDLLPHGHELLFADAEADADPLGRRSPRALPCMGGAAATLDFEQQLERPLHQRCEIGCS